jgi:hypothetical protein
MFLQMPCVEKDEAELRGYEENEKSCPNRQLFILIFFEVRRESA